MIVVITSKPTLTDRYIAVAVAGVPQPQRQDVAAELRASLADAVEDLVDRGMSPEDAESRALTELGDPAGLAEKFGGRPQHLIGPNYFAMYSRLLRMLLAIVLPVAGGVLLLAESLDGTSPLQVVLGALGGMFQIGVQLAFWVTLVFALLDRSGTRPRTPAWSPDCLPELGDRRITLSDTVASIAGLSLLLWALLWEREHWLVTSAEGTAVPVLDPALWPTWMPVLILVLVASIILDVVKYRTGHWTFPLAAVNTALNVLFAGLVLWLWAADLLLNPAVVSVMPEGLETGLGVIPWVIVVIAVADTAQGWWNLREPAIRLPENPAQG